VTRLRCWKHARRVAVACGTTTRRGYCRHCWPERAECPADTLHVLLAIHWPRTPRDATLALAM